VVGGGAEEVFIMDAMSWVSECVYWCFPVLMLAGGIVCVVNQRLSPRLWLLTTGFFVLASFAGIGHALLLLARFGRIRFEIWSLVSVVSSLGQLVAYLLIVIGLASFFGDVKRRLILARQRQHYPDDRDPPHFDDDATERWDAPGRDSRDIRQ
jgi:amino acid transporter